MSTILLTILVCATALWWSRGADAANPGRVVCGPFAAQCAQALAIVRCESRFGPRAVGKAGERGWWQIHPVHFGRVLRSRAGRIRVDPSRLFDPAYNTRVAWVLSDGGRNWRPWTCRSAA